MLVWKLVKSFTYQACLICFCKQIARSNKNGSKIENQELLGKQKVSNATICNAQSITSVFQNENLIMYLNVQV